MGNQNFQCPSRVCYLQYSFSLRETTRGCGTDVAQDTTFLVHIKLPFTNYSKTDNEQENGTGRKLSARFLMFPMEYYCRWDRCLDDLTRNEVIGANSKNYNFSGLFEAVEVEVNQGFERGSTTITTITTIATLTIATTTIATTTIVTTTIVTTTIVTTNELSSSTMRTQQTENTSTSPRLCAPLACFVAFMILRKIMDYASLILCMTEM